MDKCDFFPEKMINLGSRSKPHILFASDLYFFSSIYCDIFRRNIIIFFLSKPNYLLSFAKEVKKANPLQIKLTYDDDNGVTFWYVFVFIYNSNNNL